jgi:hypothetical protein
MEINICSGISELGLPFIDAIIPCENVPTGIGNDIDEQSCLSQMIRNELGLKNETILDLDIQGIQTEINKSKIPGIRVLNIICGHHNTMKKDMKQILNVENLYNGWYNNTAVLFNGSDPIKLYAPILVNHKLLTYPSICNTNEEQFCEITIDMNKASITLDDEYVDYLNKRANTLLGTYDKSPINNNIESIVNWYVEFLFAYSMKISKDPDETNIDALSFNNVSFIAIFCEHFKKIFDSFKKNQSIWELIQIDKEKIDKEKIDISEVELEKLENSVNDVKDMIKNDMDENIETLKKNMIEQFKEESEKYRNTTLIIRHGAAVHNVDIINKASILFKIATPKLVRDAILLPTTCEQIKTLSQMCKKNTDVFAHISKYNLYVSPLFRSRLTAELFFYYINGNNDSIPDGYKTESYKTLVNKTLGSIMGAKYHPLYKLLN